MVGIECKNCGVSLHEELVQKSNDRASCPTCGSKLRLSLKKFPGSLSFRSGLRRVACNVSKSKWFAKFRSEPSFHRHLGIWAKRVMFLDKRKNSYSEIVTNTENEEVIHYCSEPLREHVRHGSDRPRTGE